MDESFQTIQVDLFDLHTSLKPVDSKAVAAELKFLVDPTLYRQAYAAGQKVSTQTFEIAPLHPITIKKHLFWSGYAATATGADPDPWAIQMPFICRPGKTAVSLETPEGLKATVTASVYLFALGWSTQLEFSFIKQKVSWDALFQLSAAIHSGKKIFRVDGRESGISDVFRWFSSKLTGECFQGFQKSNDMIRLPRYMVMALANHSEPAEAYQPGSETGMPPATRARFHSLLLGEKKEAGDVIRTEQGQSLGFLLNRMRNLDFAITYFNEGTLLVLQDALSSKDEQVFFCLTSNIKNFLLMVNVWLAFQYELQRLAPGQVSADLALIKPDFQLRDLKERYRTPFCRAYYAVHNGLKDYR